ncbi:type II toxin -antitoxin system TacA 1-like antitoxin [Streptomyces sp. NPDC000880]
MERAAYDQALPLHLEPHEHAQVQRAAAAAGQSVEDFVKAAVLEAAADPFLAALEHAADVIAARIRGDVVQHDYAA